MNKPKIVVTRKIPGPALELLKEHGETYVWDSEEEAIPYDILAHEMKDAAALFTNVSDRIDRAIIEGAPNLKVISTMAVGFDNIDIQAAGERGIPVGHTPGILTEATADLTFALLMATARRIVEGSEYVRSGQWQSWGPMLLTGQDIYGATLGIIGMGRIGEGVARRALGFEMKVLYHNRNRKPEAEEKWGVEYRGLDDLLRESDFVVLLAPGSAQNKHMLGEREFKLMKSNAVFINTSRGTNVDEEALYRALKNKEIWAAGLDVFAREPVDPAHPLLSLPNVTVLPHIGSASIATRENMAMTAAQNIIAGLKGKPLHFEVKQ
ncbi:MULTISPECIES: 2-hydroxyacid dehydrogenase [Aneurinibacillus]|uniref:D-glycerate dehydrogenase n=1 Tax=Aneurinibacillus danicus TaxID=267746 RepID=A0A511VA89_9BACL|nr:MULTISPECIES: D-glycerate dehydrogenase [Aneurinibacillus]GEN35845.1 D-glycerate dehydrogenase [Aneurinibacillus danicus]